MGAEAGGELPVETVGEGKSLGVWWLGLCFHYRGHRFIPGWGIRTPSSCTVWPKRKTKKILN